MHSEEMARLPVGNWIVHFQLSVPWKIHGGQWQFVSGGLHWESLRSRPTCPQGHGHSLFPFDIYKIFPFSRLCCLLQTEARLFSPPFLASIVWIPGCITEDQLAKKTLSYVVCISVLLSLYTWAACAPFFFKIVCKNVTSATLGKQTKKNCDSMIKSAININGQNVLPSVIAV